MLENKAAQNALEAGDITAVAEYAAKLEALLLRIKSETGALNNEGTPDMFQRVYLNVDAEIEAILAN